MSRLTIKLFATLRERAGAPELTREFADDATVAQIWARLKTEFPALEGHRDAVRFAVNQEYVDDDYRPRAGDEIAFIPPVSGGSDAPSCLGPIRIVRDRVDVGALEAAVADPGAGAICTFVGTTRENNVGRKVLRLEYEAYERMALSEMRKLALDAAQRWDITRIAITHRIGVVEIGETSVAIAVSAPHRTEAFEACRFAIDKLKEIVPIWKKEHFEGGEVWIGCQTSHPPHAHAAK
ncbi:MAG TPA: molybdopterin converting factor subunit 1 [Candidatus Binataceae bacterium]|nr:molybdopterin converting factor subunit 1 [Candidatus Binataceae bacterium]